MKYKLPLAMLLLAAAMGWRLWTQGDLLAFDTGRLQAQAVAGSLPTALGRAALELGELLVAELLLLAAFFLCRGKDEDPSALWLWLPGVAVALIGICVRVFAFDDGLCASDEFAYHFQAQVLRLGGFTAKAPPLPASFSCPHLVALNGHWASQYPVGWPLLLAAAGSLGLEALVAPLLAGACVALLQTLCARWYGPRESAWCGLLALASAPLLLNGATLFSHVATWFWTLLALLLLERPVRPFMAGLCLGALFATRWADGIPVALCLALFRPYRRGEGLGWRGAVSLAAGALLVSSLLPLQNYALTGHPLETGYAVSGDAQRYLHESLMDKLRMLPINLTRIVAWMHPFWLGLVVLVSLRARDRRWAFCLALSLMFCALYCRTGKAEFGPRFHLLPCLLWLPLLARQACQCGVRLRLAAIGLLVFSLVVYLPATSIAAHFYRPAAALDASLAAVPAPSLLLLRSAEGGSRWNMVRNRPDLSGQIRCLFLDATSNRALVQQYRGRTPYVVDWDASQHRYAVVPYVAPRSGNGDLYWAGINRWKSVLDGPGALPLLAQIPATSPWHPAAQRAATNIEKEL
jgi:hypothetical protein